MARWRYYFFEKNTTVRTTPELLAHDFIAPKEYQKVRQANSLGHVVDHLSGNYLVLHEGGTVAVYEESELVEEKNAYWVVKHLLHGIPYYKEVATYNEAADYTGKQDLQESEAVIEGPFFSDKELQEGMQETKTLFQHLIDE